MNETGGDFAKQNKPGTERQILYGLLYVWNLKMSDTQNQIVELCLLSFWGGENGEMLIKRCKLSVIRWIHLGFMCSIIAIINNSVFYT